MFQNAVLSIQKAAHGVFKTVLLSLEILCKAGTDRLEGEKKKKKDKCEHSLR